MIVSTVVLDVVGDFVSGPTIGPLTGSFADYDVTVPFNWDSGGEYYNDIWFLGTASEVGWDVSEMSVLTGGYNFYAPGGILVGGSDRTTDLSDASDASYANVQIGTNPPYPLRSYIEGFPGTYSGDTINLSIRVRARDLSSIPVVDNTASVPRRRAFLE